MHRALMVGLLTLANQWTASVREFGRLVDELLAARD